MNVPQPDHWLAFSGAKTAVTFVQLNADLVAQSGHEWIRNRRNQHWFCNPVTDLHKFVGTFGGRSQSSACPLSGVKRTFLLAVQMSAYDPKRTFPALLRGLNLICL